MDSKGQAEATSTSTPALRPRNLRQATLILPTTGERVHRDFTLRSTNIFGPNGRPSDEREPLLPKTNAPSNTTRLQRLKAWSIDSVKQAYDFCKTPTAPAILKCSLAYLIGTSFTFFIPVANLIGTHQDGNQLIANVVVWFDPARSAGSMDLGVLFAFMAFSYGSVIAFSAQGVAAAFDAAKLIVVGHVIDLLLFCWGGLGLLAWFKQYMSHPLINTASSLASLAIVTCLTKEGVVQTGDFSNYRVSQILKMLVVGIVVSFVINLTVWPVSARRNLRENLLKTTDAFGDLLTLITASFCSGNEQELNHPAVIAASDKFKSVFDALPNQLAEARYEHHPLGTESQYHIEKRLVACVQRLAQDMGGLRSAASIQFSLLAEATTQTGPVSRKVPVAAPPQAVSATTDQATPIQPAAAPVSKMPAFERRSSDNSESSSEAERSPGASEHVDHTTTMTHTSNAESPAQIFDHFVQNLGPHMRSLTYTLKEILKALPYGNDTERNTGSLPKFRSSLSDAIALFKRRRREALNLVYQSRQLSQASSMHVAADFEEVAASCGHFSSSLEDFAENCLEYLNILDELELDVNERPSGRTWYWLRFWKFRYLWEEKDFSSRTPQQHPEAQTVSAPTPNGLADAPTKSTKEAPVKQAFPYWLYPYFAWFRREDVKFAIKVGGGATFYAMFAFFPSTKPYYDHWHLEWGLVSYMLVCSMNIGSSNTTAWTRSYGTLLGALIAIVVWFTCQENAIALAFCGWLVSLVAFYFIVAKGQGPMGRFILLTYNLSVLYSFALSIQDPDAPENEEVGFQNTIFEVALHRFVAVVLGVIGGLIVTHYIWPISARAKVKSGLSLLWLRMALIWKRAPLTLLLDGGKSTPYYMDIRTESQLRGYLNTLDSLRNFAESEFRLSGPFPTQGFENLFKGTGRMLDAFHALNVVISRDSKASPGEEEILQYTAEERDLVAGRLSHMLSVLAASLNMEYPLNETLPQITHVRDRFLAKIFEFRQSTIKKSEPTDQDYELVYCYALVTGQIAKEVDLAAKELANLYEALGEKVLKLQ